MRVERKCLNKAVMMKNRVELSIAVNMSRVVISLIVMEKGLMGRNITILKKAFKEIASISIVTLNKARSRSQVIISIAVTISMGIAHIQLVMMRNKLKRNKVVMMRNKGKSLRKTLKIVAA